MSAAVFVCAVFSPVEANAQSGNEEMIEQAAAMFGYTSLSNAQWEQLEMASEQILEGVRSSRHVINMSQAIAIAYVGLVLKNQPLGMPQDDNEDDDRVSNACPPLAESVYAFAEFGNNDRNFSLWLKMSLRDDVEEMIETIKTEATNCECYEVSDVAVEIRIDTRLTQEKFQTYAEDMADALKGCR